MDFEGASADSNPRPDPDADPSPVELMNVPNPEDADVATGAERTAAEGSPPPHLYPTPKPDQLAPIPDAEHVVVDRVNSLNFEDVGETAVAETLGSGGSTATVFYQQLNPDNSNPNSGAEPAKVENMSALNFEVHGNASGAERPSGGGTLPSDFYMAYTEIEFADEGSPVAEDMAGTSSLSGRDAWREGSEQDLDVPPSPSSSGYAGERGSSGGVSSGIEETDDPGALLDDWSRKRHLDEVSLSWSWEHLTVNSFFS